MASRTSQKAPQAVKKPAAKKPAKKAPKQSANQAAEIKGAIRGGIANLRPFQPGQSGNPGGRPKAEKAVKALAREHTADAIKTLAEILKNTDASESSRVQAATALLDRGWGKPLQQLEVGEAGAFSELAEEELDRYIEERAAQLALLDRGMPSSRVTH